MGDVVDLLVSILQYFFKEKLLFRPGKSLSLLDYNLAL